ncbi:MAG: ABC transporter ATP-binding protein [Chitinophagales bacterium]|nr:ABC transporter ATP-binding protein [Hyphomicrobiales bacterium]
MIELRGVSHAFDGAPVLRDVNLRLSERRIGVIGANGSGKSTFARALNGLLIPAQGEVLVDGVSTRKDGRAARRKVGLVFQNPEHQIVMPTVEEDLAFGPKNLGLDAAEIERRMSALLAGYGLAEKRTHAAHLLSGGEKKLLTLLSVVIMEPDVIVFDEPMNSLDLPSQRKITAVIDDLPQRVITITHDLALIKRYDRVILFERGAVAADGAPGDVIRHYLETV